MTRLADRGITLPEVGLGTAALGGLYSPVDASAAEDLIHHALDLGVRYVDTAAYYGHGQSEQILGRALAVRQSIPMLSTKVGYVLGAPLIGGAPRDVFRPAEPCEVRRGFSAEDVRASLLGSLDRLGRDSVDIVYIHDPEEHLDEVISTAIPALQQLRAEGRLRAIGVGMSDVEGLARLVSAADVDCVLVAGRFSLLDQTAAGQLLPLCRSRGVSVVNAGVFSSGILAGSSSTVDYARAPEAVIERVRLLESVCRAHGASLPLAALHFARSHSAVDSVLLGPRSRDELDECLELLPAEVQESLWLELAQRGLVPRQWLPAEES